MTTLEVREPLVKLARAIVNGRGYKAEVQVCNNGDATFTFPSSHQAQCVHAQLCRGFSFSIEETEDELEVLYGQPHSDFVKLSGV